MTKTESLGYKSVTQNGRYKISQELSSNPSYVLHLKTLTFFYIYSHNHEQILLADCYNNNLG